MTWRMLSLETRCLVAERAKRTLILETLALLSDISPQNKLACGDACGHDPCCLGWFSSGRSASNRGPHRPERWGPSVKFYLTPRADPGTLMRDGGPEPEGDIVARGGACARVRRRRLRHASARRPAAARDRRGRERRDLSRARERRAAVPDRLVPAHPRRRRRGEVLGAPGASPLRRRGLDAVCAGGPPGRR